jgi:hypothetical protein
MSVAAFLDARLCAADVNTIGAISMAYHGEIRSYAGGRFIDIDASDGTVVVSILQERTKTELRLQPEEAANLVLCLQAAIKAT